MNNRFARMLQIAACFASVTQFCHLAHAVQNPQQAAGGVPGTAIPDSAEVYGQDYWYGTLTNNSSQIGGIQGAIYGQLATVAWYTYVSDGHTAVTFDMQGSSMAFGYNGFGSSNDGELALYDSNGHFIGGNQSALRPSTGDTVVAPPTPGAQPSPQQSLRQPLDPRLSEGDNYGGTSWYNTNQQGLANLAFVNNHQNNPLWTPGVTGYDPNSDWNQYSVLAAGTYYLAVTGYSTYFAGDPHDINSGQSFVPTNFTDTAYPFGVSSIHAMSGTFQINVRIAGDMNQDGTVDLSDMYSLKTKIVNYLPSIGIPSEGYIASTSGGTTTYTWSGLVQYDLSGNLTLDLARFDLTGNDRIDFNDLVYFLRITSLVDPGSTWNPAAGSTWGTFGNWKNNYAPQILTDGANFTDATATTNAVTLDQDVTLSLMNFANATSGYSITGAHTIHLAAYYSGPVTIGITSGTHTLSPSLVSVESNLAVAGTGGVLTIGGTGGGGVSFSTGVSFTKSGAGGLILAGAVSTTTGNMFLISGGALALRNSNGPLSVPIDVGGTLILGNGTSISSVQSQVAISRGTGNWAGSAGLYSSAAAAAYAANGNHEYIGLAVISGSDYMRLNGSSSSIAGIALLASDVIVKYTWAGDANADGVISLDDYLQLDAGYSKHLTGWVNGDFNGDGTVNAADYALIDAAYAHQSGRLADGLISEHAAEFGAAYTDALATLTAAVPEPGTLAVLGLGVMGLLSRGRGRRRG